jgi:hypothetical protein
MWKKNGKKRGGSGQEDIREEGKKNRKNLIGLALVSRRAQAFFSSLLPTSGTGTA